VDTLQISIEQLLSIATLILFVFLLLGIALWVERGKRKNYESLINQIGDPEFKSMLAYIAAEKWKYMLKKEALYVEDREKYIKSYSPENTGILDALKMRSEDVQVARSSYDSFIELAATLGFPLNPSFITSKLRSLNSADNV